MKKFNEFLNENQTGIPTIAYELILKGEKYFIIANAKDTQMQVTFKEDGTKVDNFSINYLENEEDVEFKKINHIPPQILKSLEDMGAVVSSSLNVMKEPIEEPTEETKPKKSYANMGQSELNYQLNVAIDNEDWETAKEISTYLKEPLSESIVDKMTSIENEELKEIIDLLEENGYNYRGINIEDEGERNRKNRNKDVMWYVYGDDKFVEGKERDPKTHYISITKDSKLQEVKDRIQLYKKRYNL